jgi:hypothetical protein
MPHSGANSLGKPWTSRDQLLEIRVVHTETLSPPGKTMQHTQISSKGARKLGHVSLGCLRTDNLAIGHTVLTGVA